MIYNHVRGTPIMHLKTAGLLPPSNIERMVVSLQNDIFSQYGLPSALALPAFVPLSFHSANVTALNFISLFESTIYAFPLISGTVHVRDDCLFLSLQTDETGESGLEKILSRLANLSPFEAEPPIPVTRGIFLCHSRDRMQLAAIAREIPVLPSFRFASFHFGLIDINWENSAGTTDEAAPVCWEQTSWNVETRIKARRSSSIPHPAKDRRRPSPR